MRCKLLCPSCGAHTIEFESFKAMILLAPNLALMKYTCPGCRLSLCATVKLSPAIEHRFRQTIQSIEASAHPETEVSRGEKTTTPHTLPDKSTLSYTAHLLMEDNNPGADIIFPLRSCIADVKDALEEFKNQIDAIDTVDDAIREIGTDCHHEKRDV